MQHIVTKFGGTSVSSSKNWHNIAAITKQHIANQLQPIIVCSALTDASNQLEKLVDWCGQGPPKARVTSVEITELPFQSFNDFSIARF